MAADRIGTDADKRKVRFENDRVHVLEYRDEPGQCTFARLFKKFDYPWLQIEEPQAGFAFARLVHPSSEAL